MILQTERLRLRHFTMDDLDLIIDINNHPECIRFNRWDSMSVEDCRKTLENWIAKYPSLEGCGVLCLETLDGEKVGMTFLMPQEKDGEYEIGFRFRRCHWGKGYATEISRNLLDYAKNQLHATSVIGLVNVENFRSQRVFEKLNFQRVPWDSEDGIRYQFDF